VTKTSILGVASPATWVVYLSLVNRLICNMKMKKSIVQKPALVVTINL